MGGVLKNSHPFLRRLNPLIEFLRELKIHQLIISARDHQHRRIKINPLVSTDPVRHSHQHSSIGERVFVCIQLVVPKIAKRLPTIILRSLLAKPLFFDEQCSRSTSLNYFYTAKKIKYLPFHCIYAQRIFPAQIFSIGHFPY